MDPQKKILVIDFCNYEDYPIGGYLSFAKNLMESFGNDLALAGITTNDNDPIGRWFKKVINGIFYDFFAIARYDNLKTKHLIPDRLVSYLLVKYYKKKISEINIRNIFIQRQEILLAVADTATENCCYCFAGLENPLNISKYKYARNISSLFEKYFFRRLKYVNTILASGDENAINEMILRSKGMISRESVTKFPTRINTDIFKPLSKSQARRELNLSDSATIVITTGRLASMKGWKFMIDCFVLFLKEIPDSLFYLIGDGEDFEEIQDYVSQVNLTDKIILTGKKKSEEIALFLNAADLFIMGSYKEGWSTSLSEALACGIPSCVTDFSSAREIIRQGQNGFVIEKHDVELFVKAMFESLKIQRPVFNEYIKAFSSNKMKEEISRIWNLV
jgi:glycosyltransferase involved in cell wall biosynthesis